MACSYNSMIVLLNKALCGFPVVRNEFEQQQLIIVRVILSHYQKTMCAGAQQERARL